MKFTAGEIIFGGFFIVGLLLFVFGYCRRATGLALDKKAPFLSKDYLKEVKHPTKEERRDNLTESIFIMGTLLFAFSLITAFCYLLFT